jgi:hypothetical protein
VKPLRALPTLALLLGACNQAPRLVAVEGGAAQLGTPNQQTRLQLAEAATTRLDVGEASRHLAGATGPRALLAKARLALYLSDCEGALGHLSGATVQGLPGALDLRALAAACHGATAGAVVVEDAARGIWIRVQDEADQVLIPLLLPVIDQARQRIGADLGVDLPRPLRLDLVRDLFSLAAVSGLPLEAAETTGTVAVARWGKVTMLSPRATAGGYPWADTLAHELTHLMLTRASADRAPLWLQEGVAKTMEERWRARRPFDGEPDADEVSLLAARAGRQVGVTKLGPSIAMLPSADAARIAFAEVSSFINHWMAVNGPRALPLLLRDLAVAKDAESAMRSVSGLSVVDWELLWRHELSRRVALGPTSSIETPEIESLSAPEISRTLRIAELLYDAGYVELSSERARADLDSSPHVAALRYAAARGNPEPARRAEALGEVEDLDGPFAGWLALSGALARLDQSSALGEAMQEHALALDPLAADVACGGAPPPGPGHVQADALNLQPQAPPPEARQPEVTALCDHVRALPSRTAR